MAALIDLRDAIQIFYRKTSPEQFEFFNGPQKENTNTKSPSVSGTIPLQSRRCALVGNSGVLTGSRCGKDIDDHEFIIRMNLAPTGGVYADDVGSKISIVTMNRAQLQWVVECAVNRTHANEDRCADLTERLRSAQGGIVWYTKGGYEGRLSIVAAYMKKMDRGRQLDIRWAYSPSVTEGICRK